MATSHGRSFPPGSLDPYLEWAIENDFRHLRPGQWLPMMVEFRIKGRIARGQPTALQAFTQLHWLDAGLKKSVKVPEIFLRPPDAISRSRYFNFCVLLIDRDQAAAVTMSAGWRNTISGMSFSPPMDLPTTAAASPRSSNRKPGLLARIVAFVQQPIERWMVLTPVRRQAGAVLPFGGVGSLSKNFNAMPPTNAGGPAPSPPVPGATPVPTPPGVVSPGSIGGGARVPPPAAGRVAIAVLDEGIAFAHARFQSPGGPRIEYLWNQNGVPVNALGNAMPGNELTAATIANAMNAATANGRVDEDAVYRAVGGLRYNVGGYKALGRRRSHGTHVMSLAAELSPGVAPANRPIIAVELPEAAVGDPVGTPLDAYIFFGVVYALARAQTLAAGGNLPVVCNISYGPHHGSHDGRSRFERMLDRLIKVASNSATPLEVVLAAGNFRQTRIHMTYLLTAGQPQTFSWRIQPEDPRPSFLELWIPVSAGPGIAVTVTPPGGMPVAISSANPVNWQPGPFGNVFALWLDQPASGSVKQRIVVAIQPTVTDPPLTPNLPTAPSGLWNMQMTSTLPARVEGWIWRKANPPGRRTRARQSYFDDPAYQRFEPSTAPREFDSVPPAPNPSYVTRHSTLSGYATGKRTYVVGGYRRFSRNPDMPARYTSAGPTSGSARSRPAPDLLAPSDDSIACQGILSAGTRSGCVVATNGTSVAAPQFARWLADRIAAGRPVVTPPTPIVSPPLVGPPVGPLPPGRPVIPAVDVVPVTGNGCLLLPAHPYRI